MTDLLRPPWPHPRCPQERSIHVLLTAVKSCASNRPAPRDCCPRFRVLASAAHGRHPRFVRALLARGGSAARHVATHREERGAGRGRVLLPCLGQRHGHSHGGRPRPRGHGGTYTARAKTFGAVRAVYSDPLHAAIYTHGHVDHACGLPPFLEEARAKGWPEPSIVGHPNISARFDRYRLTAPWNGLINSKQFSTRSVWPTEYDYPTVV